MTMATKRTQQELAYIHHWRRRGYKVMPGEPVPTDTVTPPAHQFMSLAERNRARIERCKQEMGAAYLLHPENKGVKWGWRLK